MGLDMHLTGVKSIAHRFTDDEEYQTEDGFRLAQKRLDIGYWRKHPNLHGYIVREFASGVDECQEIWLSAQDLLKIIEAVKKKELPHTTGFFFGASRDTQDQIDHDVSILEGAKKWMLDAKDGETRVVLYQASW